MKNSKIIKEAISYFLKFKFEIVSLFYVCAIVKDVIWYSSFGVNILSYSSIQDTFISFLNHTIIFIVCILNYYLFSSLFTPKKLKEGKKILKILFFITFLGTTIFSFFLLKKPFSLLTLFILFSIIYDDYKKKKFKRLRNICILFLIGFSTIEPLTQGIITKSENENPKQFTWKNSNMDYYSFNYENVLIDTKLEEYFLIGNIKDYFFIYDKCVSETLIINKIDCKNIKAKFKMFK